jgi:hypothetical protein
MDLPVGLSMQPPVFERFRGGRKLLRERQCYHQQYLSDAKNPNGYCGLGGTGVSAQLGCLQVAPTRNLSAFNDGQPRLPFEF